VLALDVPSLDEARPLVEELGAEVGVFKVGLQLFTAAGPAAVRLVQDAGARCFLDLKLHDIPATVSHAVHSAKDLGVDYLTVHAANGPACLGAAAKAAEGGAMTLLAVTVLTSMDTNELAAIGMESDSEAAVRRLGKVAVHAGIPGLVCSPWECAPLRRDLGEDICLMVPGVRPAGAAAGDQRRIATPHQAISYGASLLVVGRPIRNAPDPVTAARAIVREIDEAL
ncbi:MAG: orotidine-5'-phosphate decarboxylase, partial [Deltaproteobacteria bacterium]|nr:orotidine-5'-phosphate decarboxylase [Deltaproteobacteria bacterium]